MQIGAALALQESSKEKGVSTKSAPLCCVEMVENPFFFRLKRMSVDFFLFIGAYSFFRYRRSQVFFF